MKISGISTFYPNFIRTIPKNTSVQHDSVCFSSRKKVLLKDKFYSDVPASLIKKKNDTWIIKVGKKSVGAMFFSEAIAPIRGDNYPENYKGKPYLFINAINSFGEYKRVGSILVKELVHESKKRGYGGRICLNATTTNQKMGSPVPFYSKMGFQATNAEKQEMIENSLKKGEPIPKCCEAVTMFLPENVIKSYLC